MVIAAALVATSLVTAGASKADNWIAWRVDTSTTPATMIVGFGTDENAACECAGHSSPYTNCKKMVVPYPIPECGQQGPAVAKDTYKLDLNLAGEEFTRSYQIPLPKNTEGNVYNSEVLAPVTVRIIAAKIANNAGKEISSLTLTLVEVSDPPPGSGISPTP